MLEKKGWKINKNYKIEFFDIKGDFIREINIKALSKHLAVIKLSIMAQKNKTLNYDITRTEKVKINGEIVYVNNKLQVIEED